MVHLEFNECEAEQDLLLNILSPRWGDGVCPSSRAITALYIGGPQSEALSLKPGGPGHSLPSS